MVLFFSFDQSSTDRVAFSILRSFSRRAMSGIPNDKDLLSAIRVGRNQQVSLLVHVKPNSKQTGFEWQEEELFIKLMSPPVDNKANKEVCEVVSDLIHIPKSQVSVIRGVKSREKELLLDGVSKDSVLQRLKEAFRLFVC